MLRLKREKAIAVLAFLLSLSGSGDAQYGGASGVRPTGNPNAVNQIALEIKGWSRPEKRIAFSRDKATVTITSAPGQSATKELSIAAATFRHLEQRVLASGFFDLPPGFWKEGVDGDVTKVTVYTETGIRKEVTIMILADLPSAFKELVELLRKTAREIDPANFN